MAVDTTAKRASVLTFGLPVCFVLPIPSGTVSQGDEQHLTGLYSGILATTEVNSQQDRFSMLNFSQMEDLLPAPDGSFGAGDRVHLIGFYSGFAVTATTITGLTVGLTGTTGTVGMEYVVTTRGQTSVSVTKGTQQ